MAFKARYWPIMVGLLLVTSFAAVFLIIRKPDIYQNPSKRYNVVVIVSDALRSDILNCYGGDAETPNIDWLAKNGTQFLNAYSTSPWTSPSSVSLLTGNYASIFEIGKREIVTEKSKHFKPSYFVPDSILTLAEALVSVGYDVGLQQNNPNAIISNSFQGFTALGHLNEREKNVIKEALEIHDPDYSRDKTVFPLLDFILKHESTPFFSLIWITDPHSPYDPVEKFYDKITYNQSELPEDLEYYSSHNNFHTLEKREVTAAEQKYIKSLYKAEVESVDERVGYILNALKHKNLLEKTYIVFTSDHGEAFGEHGYYSHATSFYEEMMQVPFIFYGPEIKKSFKVKTAISNIDLMPTLKNLLGMSYKASFTGKSCTHLLSGKAKKTQKLYYDCLHLYVPLMKEFRDAILINDHKLITLISNEFELYDLKKDPNELNNIAVENPKIAREMFRDILKIFTRR